MGNKHNSHPGFGQLVLLVSEAVLEVVFVSALGYIAAKRGLFSAETQKIMANLNIYFFTPCLSAYLNSAVHLHSKLIKTLKSFPN